MNPFGQGFMSTRTDLANRYFQEIWVQGNLNTLDQIYSPAPAKDCLLPDAVRSTHEIVELSQMLRQLVQNKTIRVIKSLEDGSWVTLLLEMDGADAATGQPVKMNWQSTMRIENDQILEHYSSVNFMALFEQLGQLPANCFELMLAGTALQ